jgi:nuclear pore complex protein Nup62
MGKDLGSMIEEINNASSTLSKTNKADEPVSLRLSIWEENSTLIQDW